MPASVAQAERMRKFRRMISSGIQPNSAARLVGVTPDTGRRWMAQLKADVALGPEPEYDDIVLDEALSPEAERALGDFGYFRRRYFGRVTLPWQEEAAYTIVAYLETPEKEYVVSNAPPGGGKSTLYTHDIPAWLIAKKRSIRCLFGSRAEHMATMYVRRLRRTLERVRPLRADTDDINAGLAYDAVTTMTADFGRFRPLGTNLWRANEFLVATAEDDEADDKEATVAAYGMDQQFLGGRYDYVVWDDLIDKKTIRSADAMEALIALYESEMETRVEPGGCLVLNGQRMRADDLYRYALNLDSGDDNETPKYHHIKFQAHYEDRCVNDHGPDATPYPQGCLLDPKRIPWKDQAALQKNKPALYSVVYQQEDVDPESTLVKPEWINGTDGFPGCWDENRRSGFLPRGIDPNTCVSAAMVDPSPTKFWAIEWILYHPPTDTRFLIDIERKRQGANDLLDYNPVSRDFSGTMHEWQLRSKDMGAPIKTWIIEANVAQRFMLQYVWFRLWQVQMGVQIIPHQTSRNKSDEKMGVESIATVYRQGKMRLPQAGGNSAVHLMVSELIRYPIAKTNDTVMAHWFFEWNKHRLPVPQMKPPQFERPGYMRNVQRGLAG